MLGVLMFLCVVYQPLVNALLVRHEICGKRYWSLLFAALAACARDRRAMYAILHG